MRRIGKVLVIALFVSAAWTSAANAAAGFFKCEVNLAGMPSSSTVIFRFTHLAAVPAFTNKAFMAVSHNVRNMLATGLTAMSADLPVWIFVDPDVGSIPTVERMFLGQP